MSKHDKLRPDRRCDYSSRSEWYLSNKITSLSWCRSHVTHQLACPFILAEGHGVLRSQFMLPGSETNWKWQKSCRVNRKQRCRKRQKRCICQTWRVTLQTLSLNRGTNFSWHDLAFRSNSSVVVNINMGLPKNRNRELWLLTDKSDVSPEHEGWLKLMREGHECKDTCWFFALAQFSLQF